MEIFFGTDRITESRPAAVTLGNFDGFHVGHQEIVRQTVNYGREHHLKSMLVTFHPHPRQLFSGDLSVLTPLEEKLKLLSHTGLDQVLIFPFTRQFAATPAETFIRQTLVRDIKARHIVVGYDWGFGKDAAGNPRMIKEIGGQLGVSSHIVPAVKIDGEIASSTAIRRHIAAGRMDLAAKVMGRPHSLAGRVVAGEGRGRKLGFPTANIMLRPFMALPALGVYAVRVDTGQGSFDGVANLGSHPTFTPSRPLLEIHLLDFHGDLYDTVIRVYFISKLRNERRFPGSKQLIAQIEADIQQARALLAGDYMLKLQRI